MKRIFKRIGAVAVVAVLAFSLTACRKKTCSLCGKEFTFGGDSMTVGEVEFVFCDDCLEGARQLLP